MFCKIKINTYLVIYLQLNFVHMLITKEGAGLISLV